MKMSRFSHVCFLSLCLCINENIHCLSIKIIIIIRLNWARADFYLIYLYINALFMIWKQNRKKIDRHFARVHIIFIYSTLSIYIFFSALFDWITCELGQVNGAKKNQGRFFSQCKYMTCQEKERKKACNIFAAVDPNTFIDLFEKK